MLNKQRNNDESNNNKNKTIDFFPKAEGGTNEK